VNPPKMDYITKMKNTTLSTPAQAVWAAYEQILENECVVTDTDKKALAAAIRVVADQVVPLQPEPTEDSVGWSIDYGHAWALWSKTQTIRLGLIALAAELKKL
jgi:hypothetical protein